MSVTRMLFTLTLLAVTQGCGTAPEPSLQPPPKEAPAKAELDKLHAEAQKTAEGQSK